MPTLTIKGMPDALYRSLRKHADAHRRSLNSEIIVCLERALGAGALNPAEWLANADALRDRLNVVALNDAEMRAARRKGRA